MTIEPDFDTSKSLREKLAADDLNDGRLSFKAIGSVKNAWMCKPGLVPARRAVRIQELAAYRLLTQSDRSGTGSIYAQWLEALNSRKCLQPMVRDGSLAVIKTTPELPDIEYVVAHKAGRKNALVASIVALAQEACDSARCIRPPERRRWRRRRYKTPTEERDLTEWQSYADVCFRPKAAIAS